MEEKKRANKLPNKKGLDVCGTSESSKSKEQLNEETTWETLREARSRDKTQRCDCKTPERSKYPNIIQSHKGPLKRRECVPQSTSIEQSISRKLRGIVSQPSCQELKQQTLFKGCLQVWFLSSGVNSNEIHRRSTQFLRKSNQKHCQLDWKERNNTKF